MPFTRSAKATAPRSSLSWFCSPKTLVIQSVLKTSILRRFSMRRSKASTEMNSRSRNFSQGLAAGKRVLHPSWRMFPRLRDFVHGSMMRRHVDLRRTHRRIHPPLRERMRRALSRDEARICAAHLIELYRLIMPPSVAQQKSSAQTD